MKFGETLSTHLTPEWRKQYITYSLFKRMIYDALESLPEGIRIHSDEYEAYIAKFDEEFFQACQNQLLKIDSFFAEKLAEAKRRLQELRIELEYLANPNVAAKSLSKMNLAKALPKPSVKHLKFVMSEYYLSLVLLQNYQTLNHTGFRKILKKHDKNLQVTTGKAWFKNQVEKTNLATNTEIKQMISETETLFTKYLEGGDRAKAMKRLRVPAFEERQSPWRTFRLGLAMGAFLCLSSFIIILTSHFQISLTDYEVLKILHRPLVLLTFFLFLMGCNVYGWQKAGVNHILIFEIDPRDHLTATHILEIAAFLALLSALSFVACLLSTEFLPRLVYPLILTAAFILCLFHPLPLQRTARCWLMKVVGRIVCAPLFQVGFADFWLADQLTSLSLVLTDYGFFACFYGTNGDWHNARNVKLCEGYYGIISKLILSSLPIWWRFAQCMRRYYDSKRYFPFLLNAGKYATMFPVNGFQAAMAHSEEFALVAVYLTGNYEKLSENPYFWCHIISRIINTTYCYLWDILMDFGLFTKFTWEHIFLRDEILYAPYVYYLIVIEDLLLRLYWVFALFFESYKLMSTFNIITLGAIVEIFRRYIWNFIRLENEHLNNAGLFRAVRDISIVPLTADDQKRIEKLMDEPDGVKNRQTSLSDDEDAASRNDDDT